jgi:hypothetical protein
MTISQLAEPRRPSLEEAIRHSIAHRTKVRLPTLVIEVTPKRVLLSGSVPTYYLKQLALQGVFDAVGAARGIQIEINVDVRGATAQK